MSRGKRYSTEQIIGFLREAEVLLSQGQKLGDVCRKLGICEQSYYRWRRTYGGLTPSTSAGQDHPCAAKAWPAEAMHRLRHDAAGVTLAIVQGAARRSSHTVGGTTPTPPRV